jgi:bacillithiol biosynthesis deacetylase BshB1
MDAFDIVGVCAHPDDAELVMGGTIARASADGRRIALLDLTRGEAGSRGTPETRAREAQEAARILGVAHRESLGLPDAALARTPEHRDLLVAALRRLKPSLVITQHWEQRHPDHEAASRLAYDACFVAGLRHYRADLGPAFRPARIIYATSMTETTDVAPTFVVDVTNTFAVKLRAIRAFASQFEPAPGETVALPFDRFQDAVEMTARRHGHRIGVTYGEGFVSREPLRVDDVWSLAGRSF